MTSRADASRLAAVQSFAAPAMASLGKFLGARITPRVLRQIKNHISGHVLGLRALVHVWPAGSTGVGVYVGIEEHGFEYLAAPPDGDCEAFNAECPDAGWAPYSQKLHKQVDPELIFRRRISRKVD